jgi:hypothetical protein
MATSYAPALNGLTIPEHHHGSSSSQKNSSHRKAAPERPRLPTILSTSASPIEEKPVLDLNGSAHAHNHTHSAPLNSQNHTQPRRGHQYSHSYAPTTPTIYDGFHTAKQTPETAEFPAVALQMHDEGTHYDGAGALGHNGHIHVEDRYTSR